MLNNTEIESLKTIISNNGDCDLINCENCPFSTITKDSNCLFISEGVDKYSNSSVVERCRELLKENGIEI